MKKPKVLLVIEECDPGGMSSPYIGFQLFNQIRRFAEVTLVTREKYRPGLEKLTLPESIHYMDNRPGSQLYSNVISDRLLPNMTNWAMRHALKFPLYLEFNHKVYSRFQEEVRAGEFDVVHAITPMIPRYPFKIAKACMTTPFIIGPVNGGLPCPPQFQEIQKKEFAFSDPLRFLSRHVPGYQATYQKAFRILVGTQSTLTTLETLFPKISDKCSVMAENGIPEATLAREPKKESGSPIKLIFVGRFSPIKGLNMLVEALSLVRGAWHLTLVGDGQEREPLEKQIALLGLQDRITFTGWLPQNETVKQYRQSDLFCFPAVRESGGAVVLEAMAQALPSVVFDYGGYMEYLTPECGLCLPLGSPEQMPKRLAEAISELISDPKRRREMSAAALERAKYYTWESKGAAIAALYAETARSSRVR